MRMRLSSPKLNNQIVAWWFVSKQMVALTQVTMTVVRRQARLEQCFYREIVQCAISSVVNNVADGGEGDILLL